MKGETLSFLHLLFYLGLDNAHPFWTQCFTESTPISVGVSSGTALTDILKIKLNLGTPWPDRLTGKINHRRQDRHF